MRIDCHTHFYPAGYLAAIEQSSDHAELRREPDGTLVLAYAGDYNVLAPAHHSLEARLTDMERAGIDFAILSLTTPGVHVERAERGIALARIANDEFALIQQQYPTRFRCLATLPLQAAEHAARELERATQELGLVGAMLFSNVNGKPIDLPEFWPSTKQPKRSASRSSSTRPRQLSLTTSPTIGWSPCWASPTTPRWSRSAWCSGASSIAFLA